jgi:hypothetical protein
MSADVQPLVIVSGAPELRRVPQHFWKRFARFLNENRTGTVAFNVNRGKPSSFDVREHVRAEDDEGMS